MRLQRNWMYRNLMHIRYKTAQWWVECKRIYHNCRTHQATEPPAMMSARTYKAKFVEPLVARLKSLINTLFARYFKAVDSYHRLNITNGNLYRENEMLSKINSKLKNENENLRSEVKDYKLLRKVFGHKQIDKLLEQARNIKGRKRENPRSR